jgi:hypothetical protein
MTKNWKQIYLVLHALLKFKINWKLSIFTAIMKATMYICRPVLGKLQLHIVQCHQIRLPELSNICPL